MLIIFIFLAVFALAQCQQSCSSEWENQRKCMATERGQYAPKRMSDNERTQLRSNIRQCYTRAGCKDPFLSDAQEAAMRNCSRDLRRSIKQDLKDCLGRSNYKDYNLPTDSDSQFGWGQDVARIKRKDQRCQPQRGREKEFAQCLQQALRQQFQQKQQSKQVDPCESRYKCYQQWQHENCYNREREAKRQLCTCVKSANLEKYKNEYRSCLRSKNVPTDDTGDYNLLTVDRLANKYCNGSKDPCGGYNSRQSQLNHNNNNNNNNNNNQGNNWNRNNNNNQGNNNWNNNNNQNGNNWNTNSNSNSNTNTNSNFNTGGSNDLNSYDFDSVDGDTSGGFPDIGSVLNSGSGSSSNTGDLSSIIGSANTGLDPSTFFSGGALSGLTGGGGLGGGLGGLGSGGGLGGLGSGLGSGGGLSGLTSGLGSGGGLGSGLGGGNILSGLGGGNLLSGLGGGGTDIFSQFSSGLDPSTLFSGVGKKKK